MADYLLNHNVSSSVLFLLLGLLFGSFISLVSYRLVHGGSIIVARSRCPRCQHTLSFFDLFPVISWCFSKAKCRYCKQAISIRYPLTELFTGASFLLCYLSYGWSLQTALLCMVAIALIILIVVDLEHQIIPDEIQITLALLSIPYAYLWNIEIAQMITMALGLGIFSYALRYVFFLWKKKEALGLGDVKFFIVAGLFLSPYSLAPFLLYAGLSGVALGLLWRLLGFGERFPFGPSLAISFFICIAFPHHSDSLLNFST